MPITIPAVLTTVHVYRVHHGPGVSYTEYPRNPAGLHAAALLSQAHGRCPVTEETKEVMTSDEQIIED